MWPGDTMRRNRSRLTLGGRLLPLALACAAGCTQLTRPGSLTGMLSAQRTTIAPAAAKLTRDPTAQACLTTAAEMDQAGHAREALLLYERARQHDPSLQQLAGRMAVLYDQTGDTVKAQAAFQQALEQQAEDGALWSDYGHFLLRHGRLEEAETWLRKAVQADPQNEAAGVNLGIVLARRNDCVGSLEAFSAVVGAAAAHSNLGVILAKEGHTDEAVQQFQQALTIDSELPQARAFLAYLTQRPPAAASDKDPP